MQSVKRLDIEWLRAIAAGEVLICHSDLATKYFSNFQLQSALWYQPMAGIGVELFFIISGYVICMRVATYRSASEFFFARVLRLVPMYWLFTTLVLVAFIANPNWRLGQFEFDPRFIIQSYLMLPQVRFPLLSVGWTLEHEMMFYVTVALGLAIFGKGSKAVGIIAVLLSTMGFVGCLMSEGPGSSVLALHVFSPYMLAFAFGWLLCIVEGSRPEIRRAALVSFAVLAMLAWLVGSSQGSHLTFRIILTSLVFYACISHRSSFTASGPVGRMVAVLGAASFSIYLSHWFVLSAIGKLLDIVDPPAAADLPFRLLGITLSLAIGTWLYFLLERPIDRWLRTRPASMQTPN